MWDDTTDRAKEIGRWLDAPMSLDDLYGRPTYMRCALVLALWLIAKEMPHWLWDTRSLRGGGI